MSRTDEYGAESRGQTFTYDPTKLVIVTDKSSPLYDERASLPADNEFEALVRSIQVLGVLVPILVRKNGERKGQPVMEVVDGRQRVRALIEANRRNSELGKPPMRVEAKLARSDGATTMIVTNELRRDDDMVARAAKLAWFMRAGHSEQEAILAFGLKGDRELQELQTIDTLTPEAKQALRSGAMARPTALDLAKLPDSEQRPLVKAAMAAAPQGSDSKIVRNVVREVVRKAVKDNGSRTVTREHKGPPAREVKRTLRRLRDEAECVSGLSVKQHAMMLGRLQALEWVLGERKNLDGE